LKGTAKVDDDLTLGAHVEAALQDNAASQVSQINETSGFNISGRFFDLTADSETYGKGSFGKGFASSFFIAEIDASGTLYANLPSVGNTASGLLFYDNDANDYVEGLSVGDAFLDLEALSLINRVRYDSPVWNGLRLSGTLGQDQFRDVTLRSKGTMGDFDVTSAASYQNDANGPFSDWRTDGGTGILHRPTGLNLSGGGALQKATFDGRKSHGFLARGGWRGKWFDVGETKTALDFTRTWDITVNGDRATSIGAFLVQDIEAYDLQLYTGYRNYDLDRDDIDLDAIHVWTVGARVGFEVDASWGKF